jgi:hypothetical protein
MHHFKNKDMLTEKYLKENGFHKEVIGNNIYFIKGWIRLEKSFCGFIVAQPYKIISTIDELKQIEK